MEVCFEQDTTWNLLDMDAPQKEGSIIQCQQRCRTDPKCVHFTYGSLDGMCHLQDTFAKPVSNPASGMVAGIPVCKVSREKLTEILLAFERPAGKESKKPKDT